MNILECIAELEPILLPLWPSIERNALDSGLTALKTNTGFDQVARIVGGDVVGESGTATATAAGTLTNSGAAFPTAGSGYTGHIVVAGPNSSGVGVTSYAPIISNTATILTIDYWRAVGTPGSVGTTPNGTCTYAILPGGAPAWYMGLSPGAVAPGATDTMLATTLAGTTPQEIWNSGGGLNRVRATYAHTNGTATYTLSNIFTANSSDGASNVINKIGIFVHNDLAAQPTSTTSGTMLFTTAVTSGPTLVSGDQLTLTDTITIS